MVVSRELRLGRSKALRFLDELVSSEGEAISAYFPPGMARSDVGKRLEELSGSVDMPPSIIEKIATSKTGAAFFQNPQQMYLVLPPFRVEEDYVTDGYDVGPLRSLLGHDFLIALVLVRLGTFSIGICQGTKIIDSRTGTGLVHARHKKGGSSQARFARHREKQIEEFLGRVCSHSREHIERHARSLDYLVYGGARTTILTLRKQCPFLAQFDERILRMILDIPEPRRAVLEKAVGTIWSTDVVEWRQDNP
jgi:peptide subunit release factor 1 (eRF1)